MTDMRRLTISVPDELLARIENYKRNGQHGEAYYDNTYSEVIRVLIAKGLEMTERKA